MWVETERLGTTDLTKDMCDVFQKNSIDEDNRRFVTDEVFESLEEAHKKKLIGRVNNLGG